MHACNMEAPCCRAPAFCLDAAPPHLFTPSLTDALKKHRNEDPENRIPRKPGCLETRIYYTFAYMATQATANYGTHRRAHHYEPGTDGKPGDSHIGPCGCLRCG